MGNAQFLLEGVLVLLLATTLFHAVRLERALGVLKRDRAVLEDLVAGFNESTRAAEAGVERLRAATDGAGRQIARQIEQAQRLRDDLAFLSERGERLAERLEGAVRSARMVGDQSAMSSVSHMSQGSPMAAQAGRHVASAPAEPCSMAGTMSNGMSSNLAGLADADNSGLKLRSEAERDLLRALRAAR
jgi:hypothetical protein